MQGLFYINVLQGNLPHSPVSRGVVQESVLHLAEDRLATQIQGVPFHLAVEGKVWSKLLARKVNNGASVH